MTEPVIRLRVGDVAIWEIDSAIMYSAGLAVDLDGAANCYHPPTPEHPLSGRPPGLDDLRNAGLPGNYWGIATEDGSRGGEPVVQGPQDPAPGFYVSTTALVDPSKLHSSPARYVDSMTIPYVSIPGRVFRGLIELGDLGVVLYRQAQCAVIVADIGPPARIGEGSAALARELGLWKGPNDGHEPHDVVYLLFPQSFTIPRWPRAQYEIRHAAGARFAAWGGLERIRQLVPSLRSA